MIRCDFCGLEFDPSSATGCAEQVCHTCPIKSGCSSASAITCPHCGYPILPEAKLIGWMRKLAETVGKRGIHAR